MKVAVIGAGPAGLVALKELREVGLDVQAFEGSPRIGGVFGKCYTSAVLTSSSNITAFGSFRHGEESKPRFWTVPEYHEYLKRFVDHFGLASHIRLNSRVERLERCPQGSWVLTISKAESDATDMVEEGKSAATGGRVVEQLRFDHVVICSGLHSKGGDLPNWKGMEKFHGEIMHSSQFEDAKRQCTGKRVLVVGVGESGSDIALLAAKVADATCIAIRTIPGFVVPRVIAGKPSDVDTSRSHYAVARDLVHSWYWQKFKKIKLWLESLYLTPEDDKDVLADAAKLNRSAVALDGRMLTNFNRFGTKNTSFLEAVRYHGAELRGKIRELDETGVVFEDGSRFECDQIICCTGFTKRFPFFEDTLPNVVADLTGPRGVRSLYKRMFHSSLGASMSFIGFLRPGFGAIPPIAEMQARYLAQMDRCIMTNFTVGTIKTNPSLIFINTQVLSGRIVLPPPAIMDSVARHEEERDLRQYPHDGHRLTELGDYMVHMDSYATAIECQPPLMRLFFTHPRVWYGCMFSCICGAQYRLAGPGSAFESAAAAIKQMPTMRFPIVLVQSAVTLSFKLAELLGFSSARPIGI